MSLSVFRVDRFGEILPHARHELLERIERSHHFLRAQPGFVRDFVLEQSTSDTTSAILTFVQWENDAAVTHASAAIRAYYESLDFDPRTFLQQLGIAADFGVYRGLDVTERAGELADRR
ncbi:MAG TPA: hypothetical protein VIK27_12380 [Candidatus Aquilonibacter sp.]